MTPYDPHDIVRIHQVELRRERDGIRLARRVMSRGQSPVVAQRFTLWFAPIRRLTGAMAAYLHRGLPAQNLTVARQEVRIDDRRR